MKFSSQFSCDNKKKHFVLRMQIHKLFMGRCHMSLNAAASSMFEKIADTQRVVPDHFCSSAVAHQNTRREKDRPQRRSVLFDSPVPLYYGKGTIFDKDLGINATLSTQNKNRFL